MTAETRKPDDWIEGVLSEAVQRSSRPRIAYFTESLLPWVDGVSRTLGKLFETLEEEGREFRIFAPIQPSPEYSWSKRVRVLESVSFPLYRDYRISRPPFGMLEADLDEFKPDLIHVCAPTPAGIWAQGYARRHGLPVTGSFHTNFASYLSYYRFGFLSPLAWRGLRWFYNRCDATFAPSFSMVNEITERGLRNARLWSRGIDCGLFTPERRDPELRRRLGADDATPLLLLVSRLVKEKDLLDLVEMDHVLRRRGTRYKFAFVGEGPLRSELQQKLPGAHFAGQQTGTELARWYASSDIFVFPSTSETFGNVVQEALASGIPAVVVDKGGPPGIIEPGRSGFVAQSNRPHDLADKVSLLIKDVALRRQFGERGRLTSCKNTWQAINGGLLRDCDAIVAAAAGRKRR